MPDDLIFALCEMDADKDYQLDAMNYREQRTGTMK